MNKYTIVYGFIYINATLLINQEILFINNFLIDYVIIMAYYNPFNAKII